MTKFASRARAERRSGYDEAAAGGLGLVSPQVPADFTASAGAVSITMLAEAALSRECRRRQHERDYAAVVDAVDSGRIEAEAGI